MVISIDRALVISDKTFLSFLKTLNFCANNQSKIMIPKKKQRKSTLCGFGKASMHNVDLVVISILLIFFILNSHYLIFLNLNLAYSPPEEENVEFIPKQMANISNIEYNEFRYECHPASDSIYRQFLDKYWNWIGKNSKNLFHHNSRNQCYHKS
jgi:hypothetical protein